MNKINLAIITTITIATLFVSVQVVSSQGGGVDTTNRDTGAEVKLCEGDTQNSRTTHQLSCVCGEGFYATNISDGIKCKAIKEKAIPPFANDQITCPNGRIKTISNDKITECEENILLKENLGCPEGSESSGIDKATGEPVCSEINTELSDINGVLDTVKEKQAECSLTGKLTVYNSDGSLGCENKIPQSVDGNQILIQGVEGFETKTLEELNAEIYPSVFQSVKFIPRPNNLLEFYKNFEIKNKLNIKSDRALNIRARQVCSDENTCVDVDKVVQNDYDHASVFPSESSDFDCETGKRYLLSFGYVCLSKPPVPGSVTVIDEDEFRGVRVDVEDNDGVSKADGIIRRTPHFKTRVYGDDDWFTKYYVSIKLLNVDDPSENYWACGTNRFGGPNRWAGFSIQQSECNINRSNTSVPQGEYEVYAFFNKRSGRTLGVPTPRRRLQNIIIDTTKPGIVVDYSGDIFLSIPIAVSAADSLSGVHALLYSTNTNTDDRCELTIGQNRHSNKVKIFIARNGRVTVPGFNGFRCHWAVDRAGNIRTKKVFPNFFDPGSA